MKWFKLGAVVVLLIVIVILISRVNSCVNDWRGVDKTTVDVPRDSSFMPVERRHYQPPSLPGLTNLVGIPPTPPPAKLPKGMSEKDVQRVVTLNVKGSPKPIDIIEMKDGTVYVEKDSALAKVSVTDYEPPMVNFGLFPGIGLSIGKRETGEWRPLPMAKLSLMDAWGFLRLPMLAADLDGAGVGVEAKLYHDIYAGGVLLWKYDDTSQRVMKATIAYNFN